MIGKITRYEPKHGYGFIDENVFFHIHACDLRLPPTVGLNVAYEVEETEKGKRALIVKPYGES